MNNDDRRKRRRWGSVVACKDADGRIISWQARYQSPVNPKQRVYRRFGAEFQAEAFRWLDEEYAIVVEHRKGICQWVHPSKRTAREHPLFGAYAGAYVSNLRKKDGTELSGRTKRCQKAALDKLLPWFGDVRMDDITEEFVNEWYGKAREDVRPSALEHAASLLKRIMRSAASPQPDGGPPLLAASPCKFVGPKRRSRRREQTPLTRQEIKTLAEGLPEYYRLSIHLALLVGGLRIGEVCALQLRDIDLEHGLLYVRHSVTQGPEDLGVYRLDETKTTESRRVVPIPAPVRRLIRDHIDRFCPEGGPDTMLFHSIRHPDRLLNPTTIQRQFRTARKSIGREDITFHSLRATHATMFMIQGGTLRETMDELGHVNVDVAVRCYQRVVPKHRRDVAERLALEYLPAEDPDGLRTQIARKEEEIDRLRETVDGMRRRLGELEGGQPGERRHEHIST
ncbi:tyrosine-type recombinase/integrase [Bifidobacterium dentium]|uniref:tyrosine-type recombinase/integrase n=1 Tax=Bifidobacterium dentium TaxID=1689 RepID=UPI0018B0E775|nr:site-specific integrase [Bifidobacterium dentium]